MKAKTLCIIWSTQPKNLSFYIIISLGTGTHDSFVLNLSNHPKSLKSNLSFSDCHFMKINCSKHYEYCMGKVNSIFIMKDVQPFSPNFFVEQTHLTHWWWRKGKIHLFRLQESLERRRYRSFFERIEGDWHKFVWKPRF